MALKKIATLNLPRQKKTSGWTDAELVKEARDIVIRELMEAFQNDVKSRVVSGKVWEHIAASEQSTSKATAAPVKAEVVEPRLDGATPAPTAVQSLKSLPSFARRRPGNPPTDVRKHLAQNRMSSEAPSDSPELERRSVEPSSRPNGDGRKNRYEAPSKKKARIAQSESDDEPLVIQHTRPVAATKAKKSRPKLQLDYTSSEDEASDTSKPTPASLPIDLPVVVTSAPPVEPSLVEVTPIPEQEQEQEQRPAVPVVIVEPPVEPPAPAKKKRAPKKKVKAEPAPEFVPSPVDDAMMVDDVSGLPTPAPTEATTSTSKRTLSNVGSDRDDSQDVKEPKSAKGKQVRGRKQAKDSTTTARHRSLSPDPFNRGLAADDEDIFYIKLTLQRVRQGASLDPTPPPSEDEADPPRHPSGCARTEGFYTVSVAEKLANRPTSNKAKAAFESSSGAASGVAVSRLARANTRGLVRGMELHKKVTATDTDVLKFNQLRTRKKQLTFSRSGIEGYGLFALECVSSFTLTLPWLTLFA